MIHPLQTNESFADQFFATDPEWNGLLRERVMNVNGETVVPYRDGDKVFVKQGGKKYRVASSFGSSYRSVCEIYEVSE
jgi:hypothetical protein